MCLTTTSMTPVMSVKVMGMTIISMMTVSLYVPVIVARSVATMTPDYHTQFYQIVDFGTSSANLLDFALHLEQS